jgi:hypothetical protein
MVDDPEPLAELQLARHRDLTGRGREHWGRRLVTAVLLAFVVLAAANAFGQAPTTSTAASPAAGMRVSTPPRVRGGLIFQTRVDITATRSLARPALVLSGGWFDGMTLNSVNPTPVNETPAGAGVALSLSPLNAGSHTSVWLEWSANPTNLAWRRPEVMQLRDRGTVLLRIHRTVTVFP